MVLGKFDFDLRKVDQVGLESIYNGIQKVYMLRVVIV